MTKSNPSTGTIVKQRKLYLRDPVNTALKRGFVQMLNVGAIGRLIAKTETLSRQGTINRFRIIWTAEAGAKATNVIFTLLATNDLTADAGRSEFIILRTTPIILPTAPPPQSVIEDSNVSGLGIEFTLEDETGPAATPVIKNQGEMQLVIEQSGGTPDSTFLIKIEGDDDD